MNRTFNYLLPSMMLHGEEFFGKLISLDIKAIYCGDMNYKDGFLGDEKLFILLKVNNSGNRNGLKRFIKYCSEQNIKYNMYNTSVKIRNPEQIMLTLYIPSPGTFQNFVQGKYREMYKKEHLDIILNKNYFDSLKKVLNLSPECIPGYISSVKEVFGVDLTSTDLFDGMEVDIPPIHIEEVFNSKFNNLILLKDGKFERVHYSD